MKKKLRKLINKRRGKDADAAPRITNDTVAAHREEVLSSARKYIYPLQHSKHRIVMVSSALIIAALIGFMSYTIVALYRLQSSSAFLYRVTQVVPLPIAKAGNHFVSYENYLFELRHYIYFYENQQKLDFNSEAGKQQLADYKKRALDKVINDAYTKQLAAANKISVSNNEVENEITVLRRQNRLGGSEQAYEDALKQNFGWTPEDFKRVIRQRLLEQKVVSKLDSETHAKAMTAHNRVKGGEDFAKVAAETSEDPGSKAAGGDFGFLIDKSNRDLSPVTTDALFKLKAGQISDIVNTGYSLEVLKAVEVNGDKVKASHIVFNFKDINSYVNDQKEKKKATAYIKL